MPNLKSRPIERVDNFGRAWRTRSPKTIETLIDRIPKKDFVGIEEQELRQIALPKISNENMTRLYQGANLEERTLRERFARYAPLGILQFLGWGSASALVWHITNKGKDVLSIFNGLYEVLHNYTPRFLSDVADAWNNSSFVFFLWSQYMEVPILGIPQLGLLSMALRSGILSLSEIITKPKTYKLELEKDISKGVYTYPGIGHIVCYGCEDPLMSAMVGNTTLTEALRQNSREILLIQQKAFQEKTPRWNPDNLRIDFNNGGYYVNLSELGVGTQSRDDIAPAVVSGVYKADGIIINGQKGYNLFGKRTLETLTSENSDISLAHRLAKFGEYLRRIVYDQAPPLKVVAILPEELANKQNQATEPEGYKITYSVNFLDPDFNLHPENYKVIVPERIFLGMVFEKLKEHGKLNSNMYMDFEDEEDAKERAERCKRDLIGLYKQNGFSEESSDPNKIMPQMYTTWDAVKEAVKNANVQVDVCIAVRSKTGHLHAVTRGNRDLNLFTLYSTTEQSDTHEREGIIAIRYKERIAELINEHLSVGR